MVRRPLDPATLVKIQGLIEGNFAARDELCAAAESLREEQRMNICRQLAKHLADNAVELQQIVAAAGEDATGPLDFDEIAQGLYKMMEMHGGRDGILDSVAEGEKHLKDEYDAVIASTSDQQALEVLRRQRKEVEFNEQVLRNLQRQEPLRRDIKSSP